MYLEKSVPEGARDAYRKDAVAGMLTGAFNGAILPFIGFVARHELHASVFLISLMAAGPAVGSICALLYSNAMHGRKKMPYVIWPGIVGRGLFLLAPFTTTPLKFAIVVFAAMSFQNMVGPGYAMVLKEIYPDQHRGRIMGYIRVGIAFVAFATTFLVDRLMNLWHTSLLGAIIPRIDYRLIFPAAGLAGVAGSVVFGTIRTASAEFAESARRENSTIVYLRDTFEILREDRRYRWFMTSIFIAGFGNLIAVPFYPVLQVDTLHITTSWIAVLVNTTTVVGMLAYFYWGKTIDARCPVKATLINGVITVFVQLNYFLAAKVWMLLPSAVLMGISASGTELAYFNSILHFSKKGKETQYQALHAFLFGIRGTIAPLLGAPLIRFGFSVRSIFLLSACLMTLGVLLQLKNLGNSRSTDAIT